MEPKEITFKTDKIIVKTFRTDKSFRVELDTGEYEIDAMKELLGAPDNVVYDVTIKPVVD